MAEPERRRRRPPVSCVLCRRRKIRCNRESPCSNCVKSRSGNCIYENYISNHLLHPLQETTELGLATRLRESHGSSLTNSTDSTTAPSTALSYSSNSPPRVSSSTTSTHTSQQSSHEIASLKSRIRQLEEQLSKANLSPSQSSVPGSISSIETISSHISGTFHVHHDDHLAGQPEAMYRSVTHKTRMFGKSHWITGLALAREIIDLMEPYVREETSRPNVLMQKSKNLARTIKSQRAPPWPSPPSADLPSKDVADELVDCYFRTAETVYRILHVPSFRRDYEAHWVSHGTPNTAFLVQLKLVLALGAAVYDDRFSLRALAMKWVYEAQTWISGPGFKHRLNIQYLQTNLLLLIAREFVDVGPDLVWISAGALLRTAVYMGLHKDPTRLPKMTAFAAEMRRRIWNTTIELCLHSSLSSGGPPLISLDMFDTKPPGNFDDEQLTAEGPVPKSENSFTQTSIALALRKTFSVRLAITKLLNDHGSHGTYEETLRLDAEMRASYKVVLRMLLGYKSSTGPRPSQFEMDMVSLITQRYVLSLHIPFFSPALHEATYAFSRKVVTESSLKIWRAVYPSPSVTALQIRHGTPISDRQDLKRLAVCSSGFVRIAVLQASLLVASELRAQLREEETLGPGLVRQDLVSVLDEAKLWSLQCIEAGETSIKGYFLACIVAAQIEGLMQGLGKEELPNYILRAAEESEDICIPMLEEMAARGQTEGAAEGLDNTSPFTPSQLLEDWDFEVSQSYLSTYHLRFFVAQNFVDVRRLVRFWGRGADRLDFQ
ncbi:putative C6 transcription factor [Hypoxylon crocopeplum]|nr:putative C6 transcription factor [Hypoxylon crocopeplum]